MLVFGKVLISPGQGWKTRTMEGWSVWVQVFGISNLKKDSSVALNIFIIDRQHAADKSREVQMGGTKKSGGKNKQILQYSPVGLLQ